MTGNTEVTAADIARIAGVGRAAVSNWRRRHADFPAPIGGPANSPTFALTDVEAWLDVNGRTADTAAARRVPGRSAEAASAELSESMAALLPALTDGVVIDPACGDGTVLAAAARRLGPRVRCVGQDVEPTAGATSFEVRTGSPDDDRLAEFRRAADAVISVAPVADRSTDVTAWEYGQPSRSDHPLGWVQICLSYLKPGGIAVVAVPFASAVRASGRRIRAELLRAGVLTHVIGLPERIASTTNVPWQIWILTRPSGRPAYVLRMVDLIDRDPDDLPRSGEAWAEVFADAARTRDVPSIELLDEDVVLVPAAHTDVEARDVGPEFVEHRRRYAAAADRLSAEAPSFAPGDRTAIGSLATVTDLARSGALAFVDRDAARPGDVLVPAGSGAFDAYVLVDPIEQELRASSVLRCDPDTLDPYFLACFLRSETNRRQASGTTGGTFRLDVRRARVPRMPLSEQRRYGEAFRRLLAFSDGAAAVALASSDVARTAIYGLTSGVFVPGNSESELT
jgi:SAM-dependent methyltransferase